MAMFGAMGAGGFVSRTASYVAARRVDPVLSQFVPAAFGGTRGSGSATAAIEQPSAGAGGRGTGRGGGGDPAASSTKRAGAAARAATAVVGAGAGAGAGAAATGAAGAAAGGRGWTPPAGCRAAGSGGRQGRPAAAALRSPSWREIKEHVPVELAAAAARRAVDDPRRCRRGDACAAGQCAAGRDEPDGRQRRPDPRADGAPGGARRPQRPRARGVPHARGGHPRGPRRGHRATS